MSEYIYLGLLVMMLLAMSQAEAQGILDPARVKAIAAMLSEKPQGLGMPLAHREAWEDKKIPAIAERYLTEPLPEQPDELYLDFSRTGNRTRWQNVAGQRRGRLAPLVWAECVENKGRFLPAIEALIRALCAEKTWVMPAHDGRLDNFYGRTVDIDLASSALAWNLATADWLLGDKLSSEVRALLRERVAYFVLQPYRDMIQGKRAPNWWLLTTNNWNAVCLAGVTGAALTLLESPTERAEFIAAAEKLSLNFLKGFTPDGYCSEGLGYWNYGFGHYVLLCETIWQATQGKLDLLARPEAKAPALFGVRIMVDDNVAPAFADCSVNARPATNTMFYLNRVLQWGYRRWDTLDEGAWGGNLFEWALFGFPNRASQMPPASGAEPPRPLRDWFEHAGILIARPAGEFKDKLAVALKGGHNNEHHNHNDVGSYTVFLNSRMPLLDPGAEVYTRRTFSAQRYESKLLNSFGHPVPVVAGKLQRPGQAAKAEILATDFTPQQDTVRMSLKAAYEVPELKTLERTFVYSREGAGSLLVRDAVEFTTPQTFETALIARQGWQELAPGKLMAYDRDAAVQIEIKATGGELEITTEQIHEEAPEHPFRIGLRLKEPVTTATIEMYITPLPLSALSQTLLPNGDFELGGFAWDIRDGMSTISAEQAASGKASLKIVDRRQEAGSNVSSAIMAAEAGKEYILSGKVFHISGSGIGMYIKFFDDKGNLLNEADAKGNIPPVGSLSGPVGQWTEFRFPFRTPPHAVQMQLWIHSYNAAQVEAYLDDLRVEAREQ